MTTGLHIHFVLNMHTKVHINWMLLSFVFCFFLSVLIGCYLLSHPKPHVLLIILKYKNTQNLNVFYN